MDNWLALAVTVALLAALWMIVTMVRILEFLRRRGRRVNPLLLRVMIFRYLADYRRVTTEEWGHPGSLHAQFIGANLLLLASAIAAVLLSWLR
jgi:hypothetical protein